MGIARPVRIITMLSTMLASVVACRARFDLLTDGLSDGSAEDGVAPVEDAPTTPPNIAFVTSTSHLPGTFGDLGVADAICELRASEAGLQGPFVALLSMSSVPARDRLTGARGWVRPDGLPIADLIEDLFSGQVFYPPQLDEHARPVGSKYAATGTTGDGMVAMNCVDLSDGTSQQRMSWGSTGGVFQTWLSYGSAFCSTTLPLYCFGTRYNMRLAFQPSTGRRAFVAPWQAGGGLADADARCQSDAGAAGLTGTYRAWLATSTASPSSRFDPNGPNWVRVDGLPVALSPQDLLAGNLATTISLSATGEPVSGMAYFGTMDPTVPGTLASTCDDWISTMPTNVRGDTYDIFRMFNGGGSTFCSVQSQLYCLEV
jgi:hypothetical protein